MPSVSPVSHSSGLRVESKALPRLDARNLPRHQRVAICVRIVGGVGEAARIADVSRSTIVNWRKEGANQTIEGLLALAIEARVSLDWLAGNDDERPIDRHLEAALGGQKGKV